MVLWYIAKVGVLMERRDRGEKSMKIKNYFLRDIIISLNKGLFFFPFFTCVFHFCANSQSFCIIILYPVKSKLFPVSAPNIK